MTKKAVRCAIYTRVSTEQGLEQKRLDRAAVKHADSRRCPTSRFKSFRGLDRSGHLKS